MCSRLLYFVLIILLLFVVRTAESVDYYVSPTGNDSNSGTSPETAWQTIGKVNSMNFNPGDRIFFEGNQNFIGGLVFDYHDSGTPTNPVTIGSYGYGRATISSDSITGLYAYNCAGFIVTDLIFIGSGRIDPNGECGILFYMDLGGGVKLEYIRIYNVEVSDYRKSGIEIAAWNSSGSGFKNIRITNSEVHDIGDKGISSWGYWPSNPLNRSHKNIFISNCKVYNITGIANQNEHTGNGIVLSGVDSAVIEDSEAYNNGELNSGSQGGPVGIWAWEASNVVIQFCESHHNKTNNNKDGGGFDLDGGCVNSIMQYNYSHDNTGAGFGIYQFSGASPYSNNVIRYNISENDGLVGGYSAINFWSANSSGGIQNTKVYNNTLYVSSNSGGAGIEDLTLGTTHVHNAKIYNNIIVTAANKSAINIPDTSGGWSFKGNCYWAYGSNIKIQWGGIVYTNLESWRLATGQEMIGSTQVGLEIDPKLFNPGNGGTIGGYPLHLESLIEYKLKSESPAIDAGLDLQFLFGINPGSRDFYGVSLPQFSGYDIGACESDQLAYISIQNENIPKKLFVKKNFPNPFNPSTTISFSLPKASRVRITIYNAVGKEVKSLTNEFLNGGDYSIVWDGKNKHSMVVSSGIYLCKIEACETTRLIKMVMLK